MKILFDFHKLRSSLFERTDRLGSSMAGTPPRAKITKTVRKRVFYLFSSFFILHSSFFFPKWQANAKCPCVNYIDLSFLIPHFALRICLSFHTCSSSNPCIPVLEEKHCSICDVARVWVTPCLGKGFGKEFVGACSSILRKASLYIASCVGAIKALHSV